jgi:hypothetical protein
VRIAQPARDEWAEATDATRAARPAGLSLADVVGGQAEAVEQGGAGAGAAKEIETGLSEQVEGVRMPG